MLLDSMTVPQMHATVLETIKNADWSWKSKVVSVLHVANTPSGSITDLNMSCLSAWGSKAVFYFDIAWPVLVFLVVLISCLVMSLCFTSPFGTK